MHTFSIWNVMYVYCVGFVCTCWDTLDTHICILVIAFAYFSHIKCNVCMLCKLCIYNVHTNIEYTCIYMSYKFCVVVYIFCKVYVYMYIDNVHTHVSKLYIVHVCQHMDYNLCTCMCTYSKCYITCMYLNCILSIFVNI